MERKKINIVVEGTCDLCPFCVYDQNYSISYDSGYDCHNPNVKQRLNSRIANDSSIERYGDIMDEYNESLNTLYPMDKPERKNPMEIPTWCPLENV